MEKLIGDILAKAEKATSAEELLALAKENGIALSEGEAAAYFKELNHADEQSGELSDASLEQAAGGACSTSWVGMKWDPKQNRWV